MNYFIPISKRKKKFISYFTSITENKIIQATVKITQKATALEKNGIVRC